MTENQQYLLNSKQFEKAGLREKPLNVGMPVPVEGSRLPPARKTPSVDFRSED
jgi:hypothetical protein